MKDISKEQFQSENGESVSQIFAAASKEQQEIIKEILSEERKVFHKGYRNKIYDKIVAIIRGKVS
ncbi:MAG: hypothetical protein JW902_09675 [Syntrophaceae bacterium]|nr:hypothetical protein [Syntrophaceae bacterium]